MSKPVPSLGRIVHVTTKEMINGQYTHAAIITQVWGDDMINVTVFPGSGPSIGYGSIFHQDSERKGDTFWFWPPLVPPRT